MRRYEIVRFYAPHLKQESVVREQNLTLEEAQAHCRRPNTRCEGQWFDGYRRMYKGETMLLKANKDTNVYCITFGARPARTPIAKGGELYHNRLQTVTEQFFIVQSGANAYVAPMKDFDIDPRELWRQLGDVPVTEDGVYLDGPFLQFLKGDKKEDVWHWFEDTFPGFSVAVEARLVQVESNLKKHLTGFIGQPLTPELHAAAVKECTDALQSAVKSYGGSVTVREDPNVPNGIVATITVPRCLVE